MSEATRQPGTSGTAMRVARASPIPLSVEAVIAGTPAFVWAAFA